MPSYGSDQRRYIRERIAEILTLKPTASVRAIQDILASDPSQALSLSTKFILAERTKIFREQETRYNRTNINKRIARMEDRTEAIVASMFKILLSPEEDGKAKAWAAQNILKSEEALLKAQLAAGIFQEAPKRIDIAMRHTYELPPEMRAAILLAFKNYGIIAPQENGSANTNTSTSPGELSAGGGK